MPEPTEWFDQLYREHAERLFKQAVLALRDEHLAEDLVEETYVRLLAREETVRNHPNPGGWLSQALKHLIADEKKAARRQREVPLTIDVAAPEDEYVPPLGDLLPRELAPKEREILLFLFEEELTYPEIAERLGISVLNCRTRAFRAKARYRQLKEREK